MEASDEETKWNFESSGDETGTAAEVPAVVLPKPKGKVRPNRPTELGVVSQSWC